MEKTLNSVRVSVSNWMDDAAFSRLLAFLTEYGDCVQQLAFFSSDFHPPLPLKTARKHFSVLRGRMREARKAGFSCGIDILSTVGHHPERADEALQGPWRRATDIDGRACPASFCPGDEAYLEEYVKPLYEACCAAEPEFIWIDDDVRSGHIPIGNACFCDGCIEAFNAGAGRGFTRRTLKAALDAPGSRTLREEWLTFQSEKIARLFRFIRETVNGCGGRIALGFMTGERYFEGYDFPLWARALSEDGKYGILWRPGGGAYTDRPFSAMIEKSKQIGRQCARLPDCVTSVQSEIENFPYRLLQKSPRTTALEALMHVGAGCTGAAFNILPSVRGGEPVSVTRGHFDAIRAALPFEKLLVALLGRSPTVGVYGGWHPHAQTAARRFCSGEGGYSPDHWNALFSLGLPECFDFDRALCYLLAGAAPTAFSEKELLHMLSTGVFMDASALRTLNEMGYGTLTGFSVGEAFSEDRVEVYADHPINDGFVGCRRLCPQVFVRGDSAALRADPAAEKLSYLTDHHGKVAADCVLGIYTNKLGGKVCVSSHYAAADPGDTFKSAQLKRIFRVLSGDRLPFLPESCVLLQAVARQTEAGNAAMLLNPTPDILTDVSVLLAGAPDEIDLIAEDARRRTVPAAGRDGASSRFILPELSPFSMAVLIPKNRKEALK